jgi:hypothetical protein
LPQSFDPQQDTVPLLDIEHALPKPETISLGKSVGFGMLDCPLVLSPQHVVPKESEIVQVDLYPKAIRFILPESSGTETCP